MVLAEESFQESLFLISFKELNILNGFDRIILYFVDQNGMLQPVSRLDEDFLSGLSSTSLIDERKPGNSQLFDSKIILKGFWHSY